MNADHIADLAKTLLEIGASDVHITPLGDGSTRLRIDRQTFLNVDEAAEMLRLQPQTIRRWANAGVISVTRTSGNGGKMIFERGQLVRDLQRFTEYAVCGPVGVAS